MNPGTPGGTKRPPHLPGPPGTQSPLRRGPLHPVPGLAAAHLRYQETQSSEKNLRGKRGRDRRGAKHGPGERGAFAGRKEILNGPSVLGGTVAVSLQGSPRTPASFDFLVRVLLTIPVVSVVDTQLSLAGVSTRLHGGAGRSRERSGGVFGRGGVCVWAGQATFRSDDGKSRAGPCKAAEPCSLELELGLRAGARRNGSA